MTAIAIDRTSRYNIRKIAAVVAGLLVLGIATMTTVGAWNDSADQASFSQHASVAFSPGTGATW